MKEMLNDTFFSEHWVIYFDKVADITKYNFIR